jgi:hypothetical protein
MRQLERRLQVIEVATKKSLGTRYFSGYEEDDKYYECGTRRPNYRAGLNSDAEDGPYFTKADITELERQGWECVVIHVVYVDDWKSIP